MAPKSCSEQRETSQTTALSGTLFSRGFYVLEMSAYVALHYTSVLYERNDESVAPMAGLALRFRIATVLGDGDNES